MSPIIGAKISLLVVGNTYRVLIIIMRQIHPQFLRVVHHATFTFLPSNVDRKYRRRSVQITPHALPATANQVLVAEEQETAHTGVL